MTSAGLDGPRHHPLHVDVLGEMINSVLIVRSVSVCVRLPDVWVNESERLQQKTKVVHLSKLPTDTAVLLDPNIYRCVVGVGVGGGSYLLYLWSFLGCACMYSIFMCDFFFQTGCSSDWNFISC